MSLASISLPSRPPPKYDLFFDGNVTIIKNKIKFSSYNKVVIYNSWSSSDNKQNGARNINTFSSIKNWVDLHFTNYNNRNPNLLYEPTVVMQIGCKIYIFVLKNASYDETRKCKLIFDISTKEINSKITKKIPKGKFRHVRFDIDSFDKKIGNLINNSVPRIVFDADHFEIEKKHYNNNINIFSGNNLDLLLSRNDIKKKDLQQETAFKINSQIEIWDQGKTASCSGHATCFLYEYTMATKGVDYENLIKGDGSSYIRSVRPLTNATINIMFNPDNVFFRAGYGDLYTSFSRLFVMWSAYYTPLASYDYKVQTTVSPLPPSITNGTYILSALVGLQSWGNIPLTQNNVDYMFTQFRDNFSESIYSTTAIAFNGPVADRSVIDRLTKSELDTIVSTFNESINYNINPLWPIQKANNFKIYTVPQVLDVIISVLDQGYPITVSMTIINYNLNNIGIGLVHEDGLDDVLQYTDSSQTQNNIPLSYHAVIAVGYVNLSTSGDYYLIIRNSWSEKFGFSGYFFMPMSFFINPNYCTSLYTIALTRSDIINIPGVITTPTTTTVYDWRKLATGQTCIFTTNNGSLYSIGNAITIFYSVKDSITGTIINIDGNDITLTITTFTSDTYTPFPLIDIAPYQTTVGSEINIRFNISGVPANSLITSGECYLYSVSGDSSPQPIQINIIIANTVKGQSLPFNTQLYQNPPTIRSIFTLLDTCFVGTTETLIIQAISTSGARFDFGFQSGSSFYNFAGILNGYTLPYTVGVISIE